MQIITIQAEKMRAYSRARYWEDPEGQQARVQAWREQNTLHLRIYDTVKACERRAKRYGLRVHFTYEEWQEKLLESEGYCHYCDTYIGLLKLQSDHVLAFSQAGNNDIENVVPVCRACNLRKKNKHIEDWEREMHKPFSYERNFGAQEVS